MSIIVGNKKGFTLVELAVVLVIIGLIVGGVLVGQDLIKTARLRSLIVQVRSISSAVATFQAKYSGLPGDFTNSYSFPEFSASNAGVSDGNGLVTCSSTTTSICASPQASNGEVLIFWKNLAEAGFIEFSSSYAATTLAAITAITSANIGEYLPAASISDGNRLTAYSMNGQHYVHMSNISAIGTDGLITSATGISPIDALQIDTKMDDGKAASGLVRAMGSQPESAPTAGTANTAANCIITSGSYDLGAAPANNLNCALRFRL